MFKFRNPRKVEDLLFAAGVTLVIAAAAFALGYVLHLIINNNPYK